MISRTPELCASVLELASFTASVIHSLRPLGGHVVVQRAVVKEVCLPLHTNENARGAACTFNQPPWQLCLPERPSPPRLRRARPWRASACPPAARPPPWPPAASRNPCRACNNTSKCSYTSANRQGLAAAVRLLAAACKEGTEASRAACRCGLVRLRAPAGDGQRRGGGEPVLRHLPCLRGSHPQGSRLLWPAHRAPPGQGRAVGPVVRDG